MTMTMTMMRVEALKHVLCRKQHILIKMKVNNTTHGTARAHIIIHCFPHNPWFNTTTVLYVAPVLNTVLYVAPVLNTVLYVVKSS